MRNIIAFVFIFHGTFATFAAFALTWSRGAQYPETGLGILGHISAVVESIEVRCAVVVGIGQLLLREEPLRPGQGGDNNCHRNAAMSTRVIKAVEQWTMDQWKSVGRSGCNLCMCSLPFANTHWQRAKRGGRGSD